jgi:hypothetical protein
MVQVTRKQKSSALSYNADHAESPEALDSLLDAVIDPGGIGTDDPLLEQLGAYSHIRQTAQAVEAVAREVLNTFEQQARLEKQSRLEDQAKLLTDLKAVVKAHPTVIEKRWQAIAWCASGAVGGFFCCLMVSWFLIFPHQLRIARGGDGAILEKLNTPEGELFRRAFSQSQLSLDKCVANARRRNLKTTAKGKKAKIPCTIDLDV